MSTDMNIINAFNGNPTDDVCVRPKLFAYHTGDHGQANSRCIATPKAFGTILSIDAWTTWWNL